MTRRRGAIAFAVAAVALALAGCAAATGARPDSGSGLATLAAFQGSNGLLSNVAADAFATETLTDTALGLRIDDMLDVERPHPSLDRWRRLWSADGDDPLWRAHTLCGALAPAEVRAVVPEREQAELLDAARLQFEESTATGPGSSDDVDERSLAALVAAHVARCVGGEDLLYDASSTAAVRAAADDNAALALQWRDVLSPRERMPAPVASRHLPGDPPADCDDRTAMEAAALILLGIADATRIPGLAACDVGDALDSDDPQVLLSAARVLDRVDINGEARHRAELERRMASVRRDDGAYARRVVVAGSLSGTIAGLRLLHARGVELPPDDAARVLATMSAAARPDSADALLLLQACLLVQSECGAFVDEGFAAAESSSRGIAAGTAALDGLLSALATVRLADPPRVDAIVRDLAASIDAPCARQQLSLFGGAVEAGGWPDAQTLSVARDDFAAALSTGRFDDYCDVSWISRLAGAPPAPTPAPSGMTFTTEGFPVMLDEIAPLSIAAAAADLGLRDGRRDD